MKLIWFLTEEEYKKYQHHQKEYKDGDCDGEYIGCVRAGTLCFDILNWGNHLWFDLYVGGVDTGYGYSKKEGFANYPYDYCDVSSFRWDKDVSLTGIEEFEKELSGYIEEHIRSHERYVTDVAAISVSLIDKAEEELQLW